MMTALAVCVVMLIFTAMFGLLVMAVSYEVNDDG